MRRFTAPLLLVAGLAVSGFGPANNGSFSVHQPVVTHTDYVFDARTDGYGHLAPGEGRRIGDWFDTLRLSYGDHVSVDGLMGREDVAAVASNYGMLLDRAAPATTGPVPEGSVRVIVSRSKATVSGCPDWSRPSVPEWSASTMSNFGCANAVNLAAMVANPDDLIHGQEGAGTQADAQSVAKAIRIYRDGDPTGKGGLPGGITATSVVAGGAK